MNFAGNNLNISATGTTYLKTTDGEVQLSKSGVGFMSLKETNSGDAIMKPLTNNKDIKSIYDEGYRNKNDRTKLFPWNKNVDCLLNMQSNEILNFLNKHFYEYKDKYTMYIKKD